MFFFPPDTFQKAFAPVAPEEADPNKSATNYKDVLGFLAAKEERPNCRGGSHEDTGISVVYLGSKDQNKTFQVEEIVSEESRAKATGTQDMRESLVGRGIK